MKSILRNYLGIYHPYLLAIYPVIMAYWRNNIEINPLEIIRPLFLSIIFALGVFILLSLVIKPADRAGLLTSIIILIFFNYPSILILAVKISTLGIAVNRALLLIILGSVFIYLALKRVIRARVRSSTITMYLNVFSIALCLYSFIPIITSTLRDLQNPIRQWQSNLQPITAEESLDPPLIRPDIYYIILDGYGRQDVLKDLYAYDNSSFLRQLQARGFYVAGQSRSNYIQTALSLASSLNLDYLSLDDIVSDNRFPLQKMIAQNRLVEFLRGQGYAIISIDSGYKLTRDISADTVLGLDFFHVTSFEALLAENSALRFPSDMLRQHPFLSGYTLHRQRVEFSFSTLSSIAGSDGPKFVFAHIIAPHPPFLYNADGEPVTPDWPYTLNDGSHYIGSTEEYIASYDQQLSFVNRMVLNTIDEIIRNSAHPPVIILQADHGPGAHLNWESLELSCVKERVSILNAYYLPNQVNLYPDITPVNSFRLILDAYFNTSLGRLPDEVYYSTWSNPYQFIDVTDLGNAGCN